jgi:D-sedoheptulose 7-phosphate isomerase
VKKNSIASFIKDSQAVQKAVLDKQTALIEKAAQTVAACLKKGNKVLFFGNGGSAADSQHLAAELVGRYLKERRPLAAIALTTDTSILTAVGNDYGFGRVFERQIEALARAGDVAIAISTSGNSQNVLLGIEKAKRLGVTTIGLCGGSGGRMKTLVDLAIVVPSEKTPRIQECQIMIGHIICERVDELL